MRIITTHKQEPTELFNNSVNVANTANGVVFRENRSANADRRIKVHSVELKNHELIKAFKIKAKGKAPKWLINLMSTGLAKVLR